MVFEYYWSASTQFVFQFENLDFLTIIPSNSSFKNSIIIRPFDISSSEEFLQKIVEMYVLDIFKRGESIRNIWSYQRP